MKPYFTKTPALIKDLYPNYIWDIKTDAREIYLTFDDGPHPEITPWVLEVLKEYHAKATFFCVGNNIRKYPETFQQIVAAGNRIGNHTFNHLDGWKTNSNDYLLNIEKAEEILSSSKQQTADKLFRPPYGRLKPSQTKALLLKGYKIIMWDILSGDFDTNLSQEKCLEIIIKKTGKGSIIVFHDSEKAFERLRYTLPGILDHYTKKGFEFKKIPF